jgi:mediator of RNA polymerase II transcription subunit 6
VYDVLNMRLLSASHAMAKLLEIAAPLPRWSPATGSVYQPAATSKPPTTAAGSRAISPTRSQSLEPADATQSLRSTSLDPLATSTSTRSEAAANHLSNNLLKASMSSFLANRTEYSDENPLLGEPGSLTFSASNKAVKKRKADEEAAVLAAIKEREAKEIKLTKEVGGDSSKVGTPSAVLPVANPFAVAVPTKTVDGAAGGEGKSKAKKGKEEKAKRRKSKHGNVTAPPTPASAVSRTPNAGA